MPSSTPHAQGNTSPHLGLEVTGALAFPLRDASDAFDSRTHFGGNVLVEVIPAVAVHGGYSWMQLPFSDEDATNADADPRAAP